MPLPPVLRSAIPLVVGLLVGAVGGTLFVESMPGGEGSDKERADRLEVELKTARNQMAAESAQPERTRSGLFRRERSGTGSSREPKMSDRMRGIVEDMRAGRPVSPDDLFRAMQPFMRDFAPLFDRMRVKQEKAAIDSMTGEIARKYQLSPQNQAALKQFFERRVTEEAKRWTEMMGREGTRLEDVMRAAANVRPDEGLDGFMGTVLPPDKFAAFKTQRLNERADRVQREADMKVQRLDGIVGLDEGQRDRVFGIMARNSRDYDPSMVFDGTSGPIEAPATGDRQAAMLAVLRPDQRAAYEAERARRREEAAKELADFGLTLPPSWELLDDDDFR